MEKANITATEPPPRRDAEPALIQSLAVAAVTGRIEKLSTEFVIGWAAVAATHRQAHVIAMLGSEVIGFGMANISRPDLERARQEGQLNAYAFIIVYDQPLAPELVKSVKVLVVGKSVTLSEAKQVKIDRSPTLRIFVMGSPRSGRLQ